MNPPSFKKGSAPDGQVVGWGTVGGPSGAVGGPGGAVGDPGGAVGDLVVTMTSGPDGGRMGFMEFRHDGSRFEAVDGDQVMGWLEYTEEGRAQHDHQVVGVETDEGVDERSEEYIREGDSVAMTRTIVPEEFSGRGIGKQVVAYALQYASDNDWTVFPYCTFVRSYIGSHPEYLHLVPQDRRAEFSL